MNSILLVEDSDDIHLLVKKALGDHPFKLTIATTLKEASDLIQRYSFNLFLLDINLPDGDGLQLCSQLQASDNTREIPVIFLTAREDITSKVTAFALGADDYVLKPFHPLELKARVESKLRKQAIAKGAEGSVWRGRLHFNLPAQKVTLQESSRERDLKLTPREFKLLYHLAKNPEHVLSRDVLLNSVWGEDIQVVDRTVDTYISNIRKKLGSAAHYIESVPGTGYRFVIPEGENGR